MCSSMLATWLPFFHRRAGFLKRVDVWPLRLNSLREVRTSNCYRACATPIPKPIYDVWRATSGSRPCVLPRRRYDTTKTHRSWACTFICNEGDGDVGQRRLYLEFRPNTTSSPSCRKSLSVKIRSPTMEARVQDGADHSSSGGRRQPGGSRGRDRNAHDPWHEGRLRGQ